MASCGVMDIDALASALGVETFPGSTRPPANMPYRGMRPGSTRLRFAVGARVECKVGDWQPGTVLKHWYIQRSFEAGMAAPYQVALDRGGNNIYVPKDEDTCIRATTKLHPSSAEYQFRMPPEDGPYPALRFGIGQRVVCSIATDTSRRWEEGTVEALFWDGDVGVHAIPDGMCAPYQVLLDGADRALICAPYDDDISIRASSARKPSRSGPIRDGPAGNIDPCMPPELKAEAYVDLILAPDGETMPPNLNPNPSTNPYPNPNPNPIQARPC